MATLSMRRGNGEVRHNNREGAFCKNNKNINWERTCDNVTFCKESTIDAFYKSFGEAIEKYNQKQKRDDRKKSVEGYLENIREKRRPYEEMIVMLKPDEGELIQDIDYEMFYRDYFLHFQKEYPNLYVFNATIHFDETTPHLHMDYIPIGEGYKQGLEKQFSITKALENLGFKPEKATRKNNAMMHFHKHEREYLHHIAHEWGYDTHTVGTHDYLTPEEFKDKVLRKNAELQNETCNIIREKFALEDNIEALKAENANLSQRNEELGKSIANRQNELFKLNAELITIEQRKDIINTECDRLEKSAVELFKDINGLIGIRNELAEIIDRKSRDLGVFWKKTTEGYIRDMQQGIVEIAQKLNNISQRTKAKKKDYGDR